MCRWRGNAGSGDDLNALRCALGIHSGKIILNSAMPDSLRAVRHCIFTEGVVEENGICSACFLRKHPHCGVASWLSTGQRKSTRERLRVPMHRREGLQVLSLF